MFLERWLLCDARVCSCDARACAMDVNPRKEHDIKDDDGYDVSWGIARVSYHSK